MKKFMFAFLLLALTGLASAETVLTISIEPIVIKVTPGDDCRPITWKAPTEREDGSALKPEEIGSYTIYAGLEPGVYTHQVEVTGATEVECSEFGFKESGNYFIAGITTDTNGIHSELSNEISREINPVNPPKTIMFSGEVVIN